MLLSLWIALSFWIVNALTMEITKTKDTEQCDCTKFVLSVQDSLEVLHGRWKLPILITLRLGNKRFKEISKEVRGITDKALSKELKELEVNQLISRVAYDTFPPKVEYSITAHGLSLDGVILSLRDWGNYHRKRIIGK